MRIQFHGFKHLINHSGFTAHQRTEKETRFMHADDTAQIWSLIKFDTI